MDSSGNSNLPDNTSGERLIQKSTENQNAKKKTIGHESSTRTKAVLISLHKNLKETGTKRTTGTQPHKGKESTTYFFARIAKKGTNNKTTNPQNIESAVC
jgi:hypothetical protein